MGGAKGGSDLCMAQAEQGWPLALVAVQFILGAVMVGVL